MKLVSKLLLLPLCITAMLISMDKPSNLNDQHAAFEKLSDNNLCLLKNLVAKEQRGTYCPELYKAIQVIGKVRDSGETNFFNEIENLKKISFMADISRKSNGYNKLLSLFNDEDTYIGNTLLKCGKKLTKNCYIANTYGSCKPYEDRIITSLHYVLAKIKDGLLPQAKGIEYCNLLLSHGANANAKDDVGNTPMHYACTPELIELLCLRGAKLNITGEEGRTPLLNNIRLSNWPLVKCLLTYGANPNKRDKKRKSPLYQAVEQKSDPDYIQLLLDNGADCTVEYDIIDIADEITIKLVKKHVLSKIAGPKACKTDQEFEQYCKFYELELKGC